MFTVNNHVDMFPLPYPCAVMSWSYFIVGLNVGFYFALSLSLDLCNARVQRWNKTVFPIQQNSATQGGLWYNSSCFTSWYQTFTGPQNVLPAWKSISRKINQCSLWLRQCKSLGFPSEHKTDYLQVWFIMNYLLHWPRCHVKDEC